MAEQRIQTHNQCTNFLNAGPVGVGDHSVGAIPFVVALIYFFGTIAIIYWIKVQERAALKENDDNVKSCLLPLYSRILWYNAISNMYIGCCILFFADSPYTLSADTWGYVVAFCSMWALQHAITEGVGIILMQKGVGMYCQKLSTSLILIWYVITLAVKMLVYKMESISRGTAFGIDLVWQLAQLAFYGVLWLAPETAVFRRPACIPYSKFWFFYRVLSIVCLFLLYLVGDGETGFCVSIIGPVLIFALGEPYVIYRTFQADSQWWMGVPVTGADAIEEYEINSPLQGMDLAMNSAQLLAKSINTIQEVSSYSSKIEMLNFAFIRLDKDVLLGSGSFSKVYAGSYRNIRCAIKMVFLVDITKSEVERVWKEASILTRISHPNVISLLGVSVLPPSICILLEFCTHGSLGDVIHGKGVFTDSEAADELAAYQRQSARKVKMHQLSSADRLYLALGCARGLSALHSCKGSKLVHRDVKSYNFLVDNHFNVKIADLELGTTYNSRVGSVVARDSTYGGKVHESVFGTIASYFTWQAQSSGKEETFDIDSDEILANWTAPEVLDHHEFTQESDVYSLSLVLWEILSGAPPFIDVKRQDALRTQILQGVRPPLPASVDRLGSPWRAYAALVREGWATNPLSRPSSSSIQERLYDLMQEALPAGALQTEIFFDPPVIEDVPKSSILTGGFRKIINLGQSLGQSSNKGLVKKPILSKSACLPFIAPILTDPVYQSLEMDCSLSWLLVTAEEPHYIVRATSSFTAMTGYSASALLGDTLRGFVEANALNGEGVDCLEKKIKAIGAGSSWVKVFNPFKNKHYYWDNFTNMSTNLGALCPSSSSSPTKVPFDHTLLEMYKKDASYWRFSTFLVPIKKAVSRIAAECTESDGAAFDKRVSTSRRMSATLRKHEGGSAEGSPVIFVALGFSQFERLNVTDAKFRNTSDSGPSITRSSVGDTIRAVAAKDTGASIADAEL